MVTFEKSKKMKDLKASGLHKSLSGDLYYIDVARQIAWKLTPVSLSGKSLEHLSFEPCESKCARIEIPTHGYYPTHKYE